MVMKTSTIHVSEKTHTALKLLAAQMMCPVENLTELGMAQLNLTFEDSVPLKEAILGRKEKIRDPLRGERFPMTCSTTKRGQCADWGRVLRIGTDKLADSYLMGFVNTLRAARPMGYQSFPAMIHNAMALCIKQPREEADEKD